MLDYVKTWGDTESPTILLLHPAGGSRHSWAPHAEELREEYHVVTVDLPAHGIHPLEEFSYERAVEDVGNILEDCGPAVVAGHSQGGYVAVRVAATYPDLVDGMLLAGADYNWRKPKMLAVTAAYLPFISVLKVVSHSDRLGGWVADRLGESDDPRQEPPDSEDTHGVLHGNATAFRANVLQRTWPYAEAYDGPVMIAHGKQESLEDHAETLAARTGARLAWYDGGHRAPMDNTDEFASLLRDFLEQVYSQ